MRMPALALERQLMQQSGGTLVRSDELRILSGDAVHWVEKPQNPKPSQR
ncbi:hypothetical protein [Alicyclobacillus vulcanalis]|uniref:Uncharacterized protein n=1 Tax=Alicyclobacillus vulcanalis TaxID=252246 RepID=A0A1N7L0Z9_9BACL|nr:hypothetical protein [Alicyclobacillus vulcanalis]SIS67497.1 hypothetical protein SAMN05421799_102332 [Alicyclobacillus vulcanalis]